MVSIFMMMMIMMILMMMNIAEDIDNGKISFLFIPSSFHSSKEKICSTDYPSPEIAVQPIIIIFFFYTREKKHPISSFIDEEKPTGIRPWIEIVPFSKRSIE